MNEAMNDAMELCRDLEATAQKIEDTPGTEVNLETIKNTCASGFRAIARTIRRALGVEVVDTKAPANQAAPVNPNPPADKGITGQAPEPGPVATVAGPGEGATEVQAPAPESSAPPAQEGSAD